MSQINFKVDDDLFIRFKSKCMQDNVTMTDKLLAFMSQVTSSLDDQFAKLESEIPTMQRDDLFKTHKMLKKLFVDLDEPHKARAREITEKLNKRYVEVKY